MNYTNPVILSDYSDPDVIRVGSDFYMVSSSFNYVPAIPVLHSENLVEWELINYVAEKLPFEKFNSVQHGGGAWAPSIRFHNGKYYCFVPFPDEGIYVSETDDIRGKWSAFRPVIEGAGLIDPCPLWENGKCYIVFAFAKSRAGFNSKLAVLETDALITQKADSYRIIFDGTDIAPCIEGPKIYKRNGYYYILSPAGGVHSGWQVALRSGNLFSGYEMKIILVQGDTEVNGPHQGALIDLDDSGEKWAFMHFQSMGGYGRVVHLQPAVWRNDWIYVGESDGKSCGAPVAGGEYPVDVKTGYSINPSDEFDGEKLSPVWQTPATRREEWYEMKDGLRLYCTYYGKDTLADLPQIFTQKVCYKNFSLKTKCKLHLINDGDETGFCMFGEKYAYVCAVRREGRNFLEIREGTVGGSSDETLCRSQPFDDNYVTFQISAKYEDRNKLVYKFTFGKSAFTKKFIATCDKWTGARIGIYAKGNESEKKTGHATFKFLRIKPSD